MTRPTKDSCCGRRPDAKETLVSDAGFDAHEITMLGLTRYYLQSFAIPQSHAWIGCFERAQFHYGEAHGMLLAGRLLNALRAMRYARRSTFHFNSPVCLGCSTILTEHERRLMRSLAALRRGHEGIVQTEMMMLCEGNDTAEAIAALSQVALTLPSPATALDGGRYGDAFFGTERRSA
ncbi:hypothetical protein K3728_03915 [Rhodobacteraceae bacterium M385]|nr:hypothetical protein K3728_03915 [Rhodobacteraceae bacterium M385]